MRTGLRSVIAALLLVVAVAPSTLAAESIDWSVTQPEAGEVTGNDVVLTGPGSFRLLTLQDFQVTGDSYAVAGTVRHEDVAGVAYLEMWSYFPHGSAYFSRTLADAGPLAAIRGTSDARPFELPFFLNGAPAPDRIEINVVLPETGTIWVGPLTLQGFGAASAWWSEQQAAWIGGVAGTAAGLLGAAIGIAGGSKRRRRLAESLVKTGLGAGMVGLALAVISLIGNQPRHVWYPLALIGGILTAVDAALLPVVRRLQAESELQRIKALDA